MMKRLLGAVARARGAIAENIELREVLVICGLSAMSYGIAQIHAPSAWIVTGAALVILGMRR
jgi:hypothetical protein